MTATMYYGIHESKHWFGRYLLGTLWAPSLYPNGPTVTGSQSITGPLGCGGMKDSFHHIVLVSPTLTLSTQVLEHNRSAIHSMFVKQIMRKF